MAIDQSTNSNPRQIEIPPHIGVTVVVSYLVMHTVWGRLVYGPYSFVIERAIFLALALFYVVVRLGFPLPQVIGSFRLPGPKDLRFFLLLSALGIILRLALKMAFQMAYPGADMAPLTLRRLVDECVVPPLSEEPVFRGLTLSCLAAVFDQRKWWLILLSAVIFSACHDARKIETLIATLMLGTILGIVFIRTKSLGGCMLLHAVWNAGIFLDLSAI